MNSALIRKRLLELGMSREEFATKVGCSFATVCNMINGQKVNDKNLFNAARVLGVEINDLLAKKPSRKLA